MRSGVHHAMTAKIERATMKLLSQIPSILAGVVILAIGYWRVVARPMYDGLIVHEDFPFFNSMGSIGVLLCFVFWGHKTKRHVVRNLAMIVIFAIIAGI